MLPQNPPKHLLILFIVLTFFTSCFGTYQENPFANFLEHDSKMNSKPVYSSFSKLVRQTKTSTTTSSSKIVLINVDDYGAQANGKDDSEILALVGVILDAFVGNLLGIQESMGQGLFFQTKCYIIVPKNKIYRLKPITFSGPCQSDLRFKAVTFIDCKNLIVSNLWFQNAQQMHLTFQKCTNVRALSLLVTAPGNSPNTDGIHVTGTQNIRIRNSVIRTGDDCISIVSGSKNVAATDIICGPGHGISIGSLGAGNSEAEVSNVLVNRATLSGTTNGVRIKTWQGGSGYAKNIAFQNIVMKNVSNPIIIDQNYCDQDDPCPEQKSAVQVSNVIYRNIQGTSASEMAMKFDCSKTFPCQGILLQDIILGSVEDEVAKASCVNVNLADRGKRICVFCGSRAGYKSSFGDAALELGKELVERKIDLVYGGGSVGLMGLISQTVFNGGCHVLGLKTARLPDIWRNHRRNENCCRHAPKKGRNGKNADAFIALPGGYGTLEELLEIIAWSQLGIHDKPVGLLNVDGYYNSLLALFDKGVEEGFIKDTARHIVVIAETAAELIKKMEEYTSVHDKVVPRQSWEVDQ
ncbi:hypothetical protein GH714_002854 [Hevea brasiliensis]|uniref:Uncharacterized protein n=1 Tax=Hevea brasiliensis TaxID=3981 RepID=A0A6A6KZQ3_HEVBR|nr:hypothetical protein GH714_002854 [Hevea brasiliensis]